MRCVDVEEWIEPVAAGDPAPAAVQAHLDTCAHCSASLRLARSIEDAIRRRNVALPPERFVEAVLRRIHRERWRAERYVDVGFNVTIAAGLLLVVGGVWLLLNISGLNAVTAEVATALRAGAGVVLVRVEGVLPTYLAATALLIATFGIWWWTET